jgi:hypothetical protein
LKVKGEIMRMTNHATIGFLLYPVVNAVIFGCFAIGVLSLPDMALHAKVFLPAAIETSLIVSIPLAWQIAPRLRAQRNRRQ